MKSANSDYKTPPQSNDCDNELASRPSVTEEPIYYLPDVPDDELEETKFPEVPQDDDDLFVTLQRRQEAKKKNKAQGAVAI